MLRHAEVEKRLDALREYAETTGLNRVEMGDTQIGFVTSGTCYLYVKEAFPTASVLKISRPTAASRSALRSTAA